MKHLAFISLCIALLAGCSSKQKSAYPVSLTWKMGANGIKPGYYENTFYIVNTGEKSLEGNWVIYYNQLSGTPVNEEGAPLKAERIMSTYFKVYPSEQYQPVASGDTLKFTFLCRGSLTQESHGPQGAYIVFIDKNGNENNIQNIPVEVVPFTSAAQWSRPGAKNWPYPDGNYVYEQNAFFSEPVQLDEFAIFPSLKKVEKTGGTTTFTKDVQIKNSVKEFENEAALLREKLESQFGCTISDTGKTVIEFANAYNSTDNKNIENNEFYVLNIKDSRIVIASKSAHGIFNGCQSLLNILGNTSEMPATLPNARIEDYPDTHHRGVMLDVARNFTTKENVMKLIDLLAMYKMDVLHWHLTDDEAWRLEIPGLEELTTVASRRGHTHDELTCLMPAFAWGWDASDTTSLANGYYTRNDFIEVLKYANQRHIKVIPEIEMPGHARAAIKAMNARYKKFVDSDKPKAEEYLLTDFADTSKYNSAQNFTDNVINVAMPSAYRFVEKVIDEIDKMYADAGIKLEVLHIGGDEVPNGSWEGSVICRDLMKAQNLKEIRDLKDYFLIHVLQMLSKRNIQTAGWEDVAMHDRVPNPKFTGSNILSYCWTSLPDELPYNLANAGYPIILGNVTNLYMDMCYNSHQSEPGLYWGGFVDENISFDFLPLDIYKSVRMDLRGQPIDITTVSKRKVPLNKGAEKQIKGLQGQLFAETIRSFEQVEYCFFPKMFGLIERAWNIQPEWSNPYNQEKYESAKREYNAKIAHYELPRLSKAGSNFRVAQPGIVLKDNLLYANSTIPGAVIRYTVDGSEPTETSTIWTKPVACDTKQVKAKAFYLGKKSVTTLFNY